jgi:predicted transcriptional regulator of viral defense system
MSLSIIPKKLIKKGFFTYQEALLCGLTKRTLESLVQTEEIFRVARGMYNIADKYLDNETILSTACNTAGYPSAISFWSALVYYGLTDEIDRQTWVIVPISRRRSLKNIRIVRLKNPQWDIGIVHEKGYWITTIERTIVDCLAHPRFVGSLAAISALKTALKSKQTTTSKIIEIATKLGWLKKIYPRLEAFIE